MSADEVVRQRLAPMAPQTPMLLGRGGLSRATRPPAPYANLPGSCAVCHMRRSLLSLRPHLGEHGFQAQALWLPAADWASPDPLACRASAANRVRHTALSYGAPDRGRRRVSRGGG